MASITDKPLPEKDEGELALIQSRHFPQDEEYILVEKEWQRRLMKEQQELNKAVVLEQHSLNKTIARSQKWIVIIAAIITALSGIFGGLLVKYGTDPPCLTHSHPQTQTQIDSK
jgi:hypothetical protein